MTTTIQRITQLLDDTAKEGYDTVYIAQIRKIIKAEMIERPFVGRVFRIKDKRDPGRTILVEGWDDKRRRYIARNLGSEKITFFLPSTLAEKWIDIT